MKVGYSINSGQRNTLHWEDYLVFACTLLIPACVGLYHALKDRKKHSPSDFLVGNRQMGTVPVALSVTVTFLSALTLLGMPAEVYIHDTMFWWLALGMILAVIGAAHLFIPILYRLGVTSVYEYFELRFGKRIRILASLNWILQVLLYMAFVLYAPSLALYSVTGFNLWLSISTVGVMVTIYTALGGMKTVVWTDSLQTVIIIIGLVSLLVQGSKAVGGFSNAWKIAGDRGRLRFLDFDPNPGVRHSVWSVVVGGGIMWMSQLGVNQTQVQRLLSCPTLRKAKTALWLSSIGLVLIVTLCTLTGLLIHAFYRDCDPLRFQNLITSSDELLPLFAMDIFVNTRVLPGIFLACIFSGSLSTLSSGLNALAAVILEDYIRAFCCTTITDFRATIVSKLLVLLCGALSLAAAYIVSSFGNILQMCYTLQSIMDGPLFGLFVLGMFFPCANWAGAAAGYFTSFAFMLWIGIGSFMERVSAPMSETSVAGCNWEITGYNNTDTQSVYNITSGDNVQARHSGMSEKNYYSIYDLSYLNYTATGMAVTVGIGILVSLVARRWVKDPPRATMYSQSLLDALLPCLPEGFLSVFRCRAPEQEFRAAPVHDSSDDVREQMCMTRPRLVVSQGFTS